MFSNLIGNFLVPQIGGGTKTKLHQALNHTFGVRGVALGDIHDDRLLGREPQRKCPGVVRSGCR